MAKQKTIPGKELPIDWHVPDDVLVRYASNMVVQRLENEYLISFFEVRPPIFLGTPEQIIQQANNLVSIRANCIAQIYVAANKMPEFAKVFQQHLEQGIVANQPKGKKK